MNKPIDFQDIQSKHLLRDFIQVQMQINSISRQCLIRKSGVSESTIDRMLRRNQSYTPTPTQTSIEAVLGVFRLNLNDFRYYLTNGKDTEFSKNLIANDQPALPNLPSLPPVRKWYLFPTSKIIVRVTIFLGLIILYITVIGRSASQSSLPMNTLIPQIVTQDTLNTLGDRSPIIIMQSTDKLGSDNSAIDNDTIPAVRMTTVGDQSPIIKGVQGDIMLGVEGVHISPEK